MRVGFVGLGVMGRPMAENLLAAGHELSVASRSPGPVRALAAAGASPAATPAEAARGAEAVITMLPDGAAVAAVCQGPDGVFAAAAPGTLVIDMSTIAPAEARALAAEGAERGLAVLDAPVSGGDAGARAGTLSIMAGGERDAFERALPLFEVLGANVTLVGGAGAGQVVKACNQIVVALTIEALAEALTLGEAAGVDGATILDALAGGLAANRVMEVRRDNLLGGEFAPGFRVELHRKDLGIALDAAAELGVELPATPVVAALMDRLRERGRGGEDHTALLAAVAALRRR
ncbi:MAG: NAD(P)-dependent oxidoreductase [Solirubrobacterales bacterium]